MKNESMATDRENRRRLQSAYRSEKPKLLARLRAAGRSIEEAEDLVHDVFAETMGNLAVLSGVLNLPAWMNALLTRRLIDAWRREKTRKAAGETKVAEETLREIISGAYLDPSDAYVKESVVNALNDALRALPVKQRRVVEAQVFQGMTFREIAETTGESIDTLMARKRYAIKNLSRALRHWIGA